MLPRLTANADGGVCRYRNNRNLKGPPLPCDLAWSGKSAVCACLSSLYFLKGIYAVSDRNPFKGPALYLLKNDLRLFVGVKFHLCHPPVALQPCPVDLADHGVPVVVEKQAADLVYPLEVYGSGGVVQNLKAKPPLIGFLGGKGKRKFPLVPFPLHALEGGGAEGAVVIRPRPRRRCRPLRYHL